jgi:predicted permease
LYALLRLLALLLEKVFHLTGNRAKVFRAVVMFGNVGFMGIPLVVELYPDTALLYISLFTILDQGLFWTYGVSLTQPVTAQPEKKSLKGLKNLLSPALLAIVAATILVLLNLHLPAVLVNTLTKLGSASMPLSLLYIGGMLSLTDVRKVLKCWELYAEILLKMLALPIVYFLIMKFLGVPQDMAGTVTFLTGLPAINMVAMLAKNNGSDGDYAVCAVMLTTLACLVTLPLVALGIAVLG